jgi:hypothetical protein
MAYQFVHLESYSRRADAHGRSTNYIFDEAVRKPIACTHVKVAEPPTTIWGVDVEEVRAMHDAAAAVAMTPGAHARLRKIAISQKTLQTVVASHPHTVTDVCADPAKLAEVRQWERLTIDWLRRQYGPALKSIIRHTDEKQWHVHAFIVPTADPELKAASYHPGVVAKRAVMAAGRRPDEDGKALNKRSNAAYKSAMREWQDSYHEAVALRCGLTRLGPARRRLTREEWKAEQVQAGALRRAAQRAAYVEESGRAYVQRIKAEAAAIKHDAEKVQVSAARLKGVGGAVRSVVDGIQASRIRTEIRKEFARDLEKSKAAADRALRVAEKERALRRNADSQASDLRYAMRQQSQSLSAARHDVRRLSSALAAALDERPQTPGALAP